MWKTDLLYLIRAHRASQVLLIVLAVLSSTIIVHITVDQQSLACALNARLFPAASTLFGRVFYLASPGEAKICLTVRFSGNRPGGLGLTPLLTLFWHNRSSIKWSACSFDETNCGAAAVSSAPEMDVIPDLPVHAVWTIETPEGSRLGDYLLQFSLCTGGGLIGLEIGALNQTFRFNTPLSLCGFPTYAVSVTFDGYTGLVPINQDWPIPLPLLS